MMDKDTWNGLSPYNPLNFDYDGPDLNEMFEKRRRTRYHNIIEGILDAIDRPYEEYDGYDNHGYVVKLQENYLLGLMQAEAIENSGREISASIAISMKELAYEMSQSSKRIEEQLKQKNSIKELSLLQSDIIKMLELFMTIQEQIPDYKIEKPSRINLSDAKIGILKCVCDQIERVDSSVNVREYILNTGKNPYEKLKSYIMQEGTFWCKFWEVGNDEYKAKIFFPWIVHQKDGKDKLYAIRLPGEYAVNFNFKDERMNIQGYLGCECDIFTYSAYACKKIGEERQYFRPEYHLNKYGKTMKEAEIILENCFPELKN